MYVTTKIRARRSRVVHILGDAATLCGRQLRAPIIEPDAEATCRRCLAVLL